MAAPELFVGRDRPLRNLLDGLAPRDHAPAEQPEAMVVSAVAGMGGVGKTTLARHAASVAVERGWFPGGAVMVNLRGYDHADQRIRPAQVITPLLYALGQPAAGIPATVTEQATAYHLLLTDLAAKGQRVLLVLDNASAAEQVLDLLPRQAIHRAVVTTRDTLTLPSARRLELDVLNARESMMLLRQAVRRHLPEDSRVDGDRAASERLVQACGRLPLAIGIAAALLTDDPDMTISALTAELADTSTRLTVLRHGSAAVAGAVEMSWQHMAERDPDAARLLRLLIVDPGPDVSTAAAAALSDAPEPLVAARLRTLRQAHLLDLAGGRWRMHDLIRFHLSAEHSDDEEHQAALNRLLDYYLTTATAADDQFQPPSRQTGAATFADRLDAAAWLDTHRLTLVAAISLAANTGRHAIALDLAMYVSMHAIRRRDWQTPLTVSSEADRISSEHDDPYRRARAVNMLGVAQFYTDQLEEALETFRRALAGWQEIGHRNREGQAWSNIAITLRLQMKFDESIATHHRAIALYQEDGDLDQESRVTINVAQTLQDMGRLDEAVTWAQRGVTVSRKAGNGDEEGRAWRFLGLVLNRMGRTKDEIEAYRNAQIAYQQVGNRDGEGSAWFDLGLTLRQAGRRPEAIVAQRRAQAAYHDARSPDHEAKAWHALGLVLHDEMRLDEAADAHRRAQALYHDAGKRESEGDAWHNLGRTLRQAGRVKTAIAAYRRALTLYQEIGDRDRESSSWEALSVALSDDNREAEAQHALQQARAHRRY